MGGLRHNLPQACRKTSTTLGNNRIVDFFHFDLLSLPGVHNSVPKISIWFSKAVTFYIEKKKTDEYLQLSKYLGYLSLQIAYQQVLFKSWLHTLERLWILLQDRDWFLQHLIDVNFISINRTFWSYSTFSFHRFWKNLQIYLLVSTAGLQIKQAGA